MVGRNNYLVVIIIWGPGCSPPPDQNQNQFLSNNLKVQDTFSLKIYLPLFFRQCNSNFVFLNCHCRGSPACIKAAYCIADPLTVIPASVLHLQVWACWRSFYALCRSGCSLEAWQRSAYWHRARGSCTAPWWPPAFPRYSSACCAPRGRQLSWGPSGHCGPSAWGSVSIHHCTAFIHPCMHDAPRSSTLLFLLAF